MSKKDFFYFATFPYYSLPLKTSYNHFSAYTCAVFSSYIFARAFEFATILSSSAKSIASARLSVVSFFIGIGFEPTPKS